MCLKKYKDIMKISSFSSKSNKIDVNGSYLIMDMGAVDRNGYNISSKLTLSNKDLLSKGEIILVKDDIGGGNIIGKCCIIDQNDKYVCGDHVFKINLNNDIDKLYFCYYNNFINEKRYLQVMTGTSQKSITKGVLEKFTIPYIDMERQTKIGSFFKELDELIDLYADYKSLMIDKIKYTMSNVKPSTDKKCKVSELYDITRGYYIPKDSLSMHGAYPVYSSQTKNKGIMGYSSKYLFEDCMIWSTDGYAGEVRYVPGKFNCTNVCGVMINNEGYCNSFVAYYLNKLFKKYVSNSGIPKLMNNVVQNIPIELPTLDEQYELSNFIDEAAKLIDFIDELMIGLIRKKKYYLNKIFN